MATEKTLLKKSGRSVIEDITQIFEGTQTKKIFIANSLGDSMVNKESGFLNDEINYLSSYAISNAQKIEEDIGPYYKGEITEINFGSNTTQTWVFIVPKGENKYYICMESPLTSIGLIKGDIGKISIKIQNSSIF